MRSILFFVVAFFRGETNLWVVNQKFIEPQQQLMHRAQRGDGHALAGLREALQPSLLGILLARGAARSEAEEILADVWSDCVPGADGGTTLLAKFNGTASPLGWLARVAINRWIDGQRRRSKWESDAEIDFDDLPGCPTVVADNRLHAALSESLRAAFASCDSEALLLLRLVYLHDLTQKEVGRLLDWTESKASRALAQAMAHIEKQTLKHLRKEHPHLELTWVDFLALCASPEIDFL